MDYRQRRKFANMLLKTRDKLDLLISSTTDTGACVDFEAIWEELFDLEDELEIAGEYLSNVLDQDENNNDSQDYESSAINDYPDFDINDTF